MKPLRLIDIDTLRREIEDTFYPEEFRPFLFKDEVMKVTKFFGDALKKILNDAVIIEAVPIYFHERCIELEVHRRIEAETKLNAIVHCKDCIHRGWELECPMCFDEWGEEDIHTVDHTTDDGFCHCGKKEEDDENSDT